MAISEALVGNRRRAGFIPPMALDPGSATPLYRQVCTSVQQQMAMTDFIREGHFSRHIKRMRVLYMERHKAMVEAVREQADETLEVVGDRAGLCVVTLLPRGIDDLELAGAANRQGIPVGPLSSCYVKPPGRGGLMMGYANLDVRQIPANVRSLQALIHARMPRH